jgi:hypothetical protein
LRSRTERSYWLRYCDASGRIERRLAHVGNPFHGAFGVELTPVADEAGPGPTRAGPNRLVSVLVWSFAGAGLAGR